MRRAPWLAGAGALVLLAQAAARADTNVWGIPGECQLQVVECATDRDAGTRPPPKVLSSVFMQDSWTIHAYEPSPDRKTLLVLLEDGVRLVRGGRKDDYALPLPLGQRDYQWHPDSQRVALWVKARPPGDGVERKALAVLDVTKLPRGPVVDPAQVPLEVVHWSASDEAPFGFEWSPKGDAPDAR